MEVEIQFIHAPLESRIPAFEAPTSETGASLEFRGIVRESEHGRHITGLSYDAYEPMARRRLEAHFAALNQLHPCSSVTFLHRLGRVPVGEASLFLRVTSAHRGEAIAFLGAAIDRLKEDVPVWKRADPPPPGDNARQG